ncbi:MAG: helicase [Acidobacteria bacterium]|nr:helicase [Acidobacteriota bacterium]
MPKRVSSKTGSELFVVDNSDDEWKVVRYLHDWCQISKAIDVATAYFEIGSLLALNGEWAKVDTIRVLMGDEVAHRTKNAIAAALRARSERLDNSIEAEKEKDDFLTGVPAIVDAIKAGKIAFRIYNKNKFHAKAYITHGRMDVVGSAALVGSSNFTRPGLTQNIELNVQITGTPVGVLQEWYEEHWEEAEDVTEVMLKTIERHVLEYQPFEVYAKALGQYLAGRELTVGEWEKNVSRIYKLLDGYQREGYGALIKIARKYGGAFLCDGVGLGKTFVGLMLIERLVLREKKNVLLLVPKSARGPVWQTNLDQHLPELSLGVYTNLVIHNHTDLQRESLRPELEQLANRSDAIVIDEAHNFRNPGIAGEGRREKSRYRVLQDIARGKETYLLTATPVNNSLLDLLHMIELYADEAGSKFAQAPLGIHSLRGHFRSLEKEISGKKDAAQDDLFDQIDPNVIASGAHRILYSDRLVSTIVVQRSRAYVKESQKREAKGEAIFPVREDPKVGEYRFRPIQKKLLDKVEDAFSKARPLFSLAAYYPYGYARRAVEEDTWIKGRQMQVVRLVRAGFLKRLESSTVSFDYSCQNLLIKLLTFVKKQATTAKQKRDLEKWQARNAEMIDHVRERQAHWQGLEEPEDDLITEDMLDDVEPLSPDDFNIDEILHETYGDLDQLLEFLRDLRGFEPKNDGKLAALIQLLKSDPVLSKHKVLIFTEYMTTARYLRDQLIKAGVDGVQQIDSASKIDRATVIRRFAPYYNGSSSAKLAAAGEAETRVLISTDVLSEGLNLQDATRLINYDLHWNPVRLMQRIGRVDRRMSPAVEKRIIEDHPDRAAQRGKVAYWNFLPPEDLDRLLAIYNKVAGKTCPSSEQTGRSEVSVNGGFGASRLSV